MTTPLSAQFLAAVGADDRVPVDTGVVRRVVAVTALAICTLLLWPSVRGQA